MLLKLLGDLLTNLCILSMMPDEKRLGEFLHESFQLLPGIDSVGIIIYGSYISLGSICSNCSNASSQSCSKCLFLNRHQYRVYRLEVPQRHFGNVILKISDQDQFHTYDLYLSNMFILISMQIENIKYKREIKASKIKYQDLYENAPAMLFSVDSEMELILDCNKIASDTLGYSKNEMIGFPIANFYNADSYQQLKKISKFLETATIKGIELQVRRKNGGLIYVSQAISAVRDINGKVIYIRSSLLDISLIKKAEMETKQIEKRLNQAQKMESIGTLAGGITHDFNNILFPIMGHTEMLLMDIPEDSPFREGLKQIYTGAMRARDLVHQILTFSRQGKSELRLMKMQTIIKEALKLIRSTIPTTISIDQNLQPECSPVKADPTQIHQIVMNLATNAYHAMEDAGGELIVSLKEMELGTLDLINPDMVPGVYACLTVADTGVGMDINLTDKIFDPFFTTKEKGKGTGMGLSVVHGIVKGMGGAIHVYSEPEKGTEFNVYFPIEKNSFEEQVTNSKAKNQRGTEHILLVDDEEAILTMEKQMLERLGYQVISHTSSLEALETFRDSPDKFDLVITDMAMPNIPGDRLSAELTKIRSDIPVLLCTGFSETMSEEKATSLGIKGFLLKPIVMKDLAQKIREVLDNNKAKKPN